MLRATLIPSLSFVGMLLIGCANGPATTAGPEPTPQVQPPQPETPAPEAPTTILSITPAGEGRWDVRVRASRVSAVLEQAQIATDADLVYSVNLDMLMDLELSAVDAPSLFRAIASAAGLYFEDMGGIYNIARPRFDVSETGGRTYAVPSSFDYRVRILRPEEDQDGLTRLASRRELKRVEPELMGRIVLAVQQSYVSDHLAYREILGRVPTDTFPGGDRPELPEDLDPERIRVYQQLEPVHSYYAEVLFTTRQGRLVYLIYELTDERTIRRMSLIVRELS